MSYTPHEVEKMEKVAELAAGLVSHDLILPKLFSHEGIEQFKGAAGDKIVKRVPGRLPWRRYAWRNDRSEPIEFDVYKEGRTEITWGDRIYSGVEVTDEQVEFDLDGWGKLFDAQSSAVAEGLNDDMAQTVANAPYEVQIGVQEGSIRRAFIEARRVLNAFRVPREQRLLIVGSDFEAEMLNDDNLTLASAVGDARADNALTNAILGKILGFTVVADLTIPGDTAYAVVPSAFYNVTGAPAVPQSVGAGALANVDGFALRWLRDYDLRFVKDRSLVDTYLGSNHVKDMFLPASVYTEEPGPVSFDPDELGEYFVRGVKLQLDGEDIYPDPTEKADLVAETGIQAGEDEGDEG